jgi:hypothetical protein
MAHILENQPNAAIYADIVPDIVERVEDQDDENENNYIEEINPIIESISVSLGNIHLLSEKAKEWISRYALEYNKLVLKYNHRFVITETLRHGEYNVLYPGPIYEPIQELWELNIIVVNDMGEYILDFIKTYTHIIGNFDRIGYTNDI